VTEFRLLGPVEAVRDGDGLPLGGPRQRALLALLLVREGAAATDWLSDELWAGTPPAAANETLRAYVSKLRTALGRDIAISGGPAGYELRVPSTHVDARSFERLIEAGREALGGGAPETAIEHLDAALSLWRGRPFSGASDGDTLRFEGNRLAELRLLALEGRIEARLQLGGAAELVDELEVLVAEHPYRESLWRQLMLALYRAQRQADALAVFRRACSVLDEQLGLEPGRELVAMQQAILRHDVPPALARAKSHNLPSPVTSFVGREAELGDVARLLREHRLLTLTGVGGAGKTRLALEVARRGLSGFEDGVLLVDYAPLGDAALVGSYIASELEVGEHTDLPIEKQLAARIRGSDLLLVLDNCEHLRDACAALARSLLVECPKLRILATSRELLGAPGELDYAVPPLALPAPDDDAEALRSSEAVQLFLARAREARPSLDEHAALRSAGRICRELDGLPLAIELAAARAKALSLDDIATRLADRFRFLVSWRRLTAARHRTLREAMDWSYDLLPDDEKELLGRLSVFAGGFGLDAACQVCLGGDDGRALELVGRLVDASLVVAEERDDGMRYHLLETVRQYAGERLDASGEREAVSERHAEWCLALAEAAESQLTGDEQTRSLGLLETERDNFRVALTHFDATGSVERLLRLTIALSRYWYVRGHLAEGRRQITEVLGRTESGDPALRRRALTAAASLALLQGDYGAATELAEQALVIARAGGEARYVANALSNLGAIVLAGGNAVRARELLEEGVACARLAGDQRIAALAINNLGDLALTVGDYERAEPLFEESLGLLRARGDTANLARSLFNLGAVALKRGRLNDADACFRESVAYAREAGDLEDLAWCLEGFAALAAEGGRGDEAALLLGAAGALLDEMGADFKPFERQLHESTREKAASQCGEVAFVEASDRGTATKVGDAIELALSSSIHA
jgi:predicted ATPase/DNA-binding SARP family transcriptional activator